MTRASLLFVVVAIFGSSIQALAQSDITLSNGQVLRIAPDGKISVTPRNMEAKMQSAMNKQAKKVTKGLVVWLDENGQMSFLANPVDSSWVTGGPMKGTSKYPDRQQFKRGGPSSLASCLTRSEQSYAGFWVTRRSGGVVLLAQPASGSRRG